MMKLNHFLKRSKVELINQKQMKLQNNYLELNEQ
jgi:hypothetical protein